MNRAVFITAEFCATLISDAWEISDLVICKGKKPRGEIPILQKPRGIFAIGFTKPGRRFLGLTAKRYARRDQHLNFLFPLPTQSKQHFTFKETGRNEVTCALTRTQTSSSPGS